MSFDKIYFLLRTASYTLFKLSSIPVRDASNGFRLFSKNLLEKVKIESKLGFAYSLELLVKCNRLKMVIEEVPAKWEERSIGKSNFKILNWLNEYLRWYIYGPKNIMAKKRKILLIYLMNKTYLITGGTGFIGSNIAKSLVANGQKVIIFDNNYRGFN